LFSLGKPPNPFFALEEWGTAVALGRDAEFLQSPSKKIPQELGGSVANLDIWGKVQAGGN